jgi:hypothetical protein
MLVMFLHIKYLDAGVLITKPKSLYFQVFEDDQKKKKVMRVNERGLIISCTVFCKNFTYYLLSLLIYNNHFSNIIIA